MADDFSESETPQIPPTSSNDDTDNVSVGSASSNKSEERRRRRENWRREHENQLKVDGTFPRRNSSIARLGGEADRSAVSAKVVQHLGTKTTASLHTLPPAVSDSVRVRSNLLRTLGIQKKPHAVDDLKTTAAPSDVGGGRHRRIPSADGKSLLPGHVGGETPVAPGKTPPPPNRSLLSNVRMKEELKYDSDEDAELNNNTVEQTNNYSRFFGMKQSNTNAASNNPDNKLKNLDRIPRRRRLVFSEDVEVVPIPMRSEYSNRIKERMYSNRVELSENAQRNVVEFEAEGWDASTVLDDENQFYKCPLTGELIHPVHLSYFSKSGGELGDDQR
ncbi:hypothetical protein HJC23_009534 [Cyclotella cryptica]|uniref:Vps72/YL1 C-terminal domain-containing protein n=1 Tax=Cyclotella cryptica TaxID=29204 RepID=A0ABD3Q748_9STRA|eukprot:CCRYP_008858-RA/>CCRYP_008858-RA protein AED:0.01 eAED:-0.01 QI:0/-1/0/1/-1/1/1/0/331